MKKKTLSIIIFLFLVSLICLIIRMKNLGALSLWMDEGFYYLAAKEILDHGYPLYPSGHILFKGMFYSYILSFFSLLFGLNEFSLRLVSVLASVITLPVLYIIAKKFFNKTVALFSVFILAFSIWETEYSRVAGYYPLLQLFYLLSLYFFYLAFFEGRKKYKYWATISLLLTPTLHQIGLALIFVYLYLILIEGIKRFLKKDCLISFAVVSVFYLFLQINEIFFWKVGYVYTPKDNRLTSILAEYFSHFNLHYFREFKISFPSMSLIVIVSFFLLLGLILTNLIQKKLKENEKIKQWFFLFLAFLFPLFFMGFVKSHLQPRYIYFLRPLFVLLFSFGLFKLIEIIVELGFKPFKFRLKKEPARIKSILIIGLFLLTGVFAVNGISLNRIKQIINREYQDRIFTNLITRTGRHEHPDHKSGGEFLRAQVREDDVVIAIHMVFQYIYAGKVDYWLWSGGPGTWDGWEETEDGFRDVYTGAKWINNLVDLKAIIEQNKDKRVWLITSPSLGRRDHINQEIAEFIENSERLVFRGRDGISRVYLWSNSPEDQEIKPQGFEAEWFSPPRGKIQEDEHASQKRTVFLNKAKDKRGSLSLAPSQIYQPGEYKLILRLKTDDISVTEIIFTAAIFLKGETNKIFTKSLAGKDFKKNNTYQNFEFKFYLNKEKELELRMLFLANGNVWIDYLDVRKTGEASGV
jgi:4-amino-4-deoxy-L-arabinose transferase-like glycosyltransferase